MLRKYEPNPSLVLEWGNLELDAYVTFEEHPVRILDLRDQVLGGKMIQLVKVLWSNYGVEKVT